jgi:tetratricopeptide (TPR) repeat protein
MSTADFDEVSRLHDAGMIASRTGEPSKAIEIFRRAVRLAEGAGLVEVADHCRFHQAGQLISMDRLTDAIAVLSPVVRRNITVSTEEHNESKEFTIHSDAPTNLRASIVMYLMAAVDIPVRLERLEQTFHEADDLNRERRWTLFQAAVLLQKATVADARGRPDEAISLAKQVAAGEELRGGAYGRLAEVYLIQGKLDEAENAHERQIEIDPLIEPKAKSMDCRFRARLLGRRGQKEEALEMARRAIFYAQELKDDSFRVIVQKSYAYCMFEVGKSERCREVVDSILKQRRSESRFSRLHNIQFIGDFHHARARDLLECSEFSGIQLSSVPAERLLEARREIRRARACYKIALRIAKVIDERLAGTRYIGEVEKEFERIEAAWSALEGPQ